MAEFLSRLRPVYVVGVGWHRYQRKSETPYVTLGLKAVREALSDARLEWAAVEFELCGDRPLGYGLRSGDASPSWRARPAARSH